MNAPRIILASTSPYRRQLLARLRLAFAVQAPDCDETARPDEPASELVVRLARDKAQAVAAAAPDALVIGSDQVATVDEQILTKPGGPARAREQLRACSGRTVVFHTGLCIIDTRTGDAAVERAVYEIVFRHLDAAEIERYLEAEQPYDCAGSIRSEGYAVTLFERMSGDDPSALIGLPLIPLARMLRARGVALP